MRPSLLLICSTFLLSIACTADDDIEGKKCDISKPLNQQCVSGYKCVCTAPPDPNSCVCNREGQGLTQQSLSAEPASSVVYEWDLENCLDPKASDPSWRFLRRVGRPIED